MPVAGRHRHAPRRPTRLAAAAALLLTTLGAGAGALVAAPSASAAPPAKCLDTLYLTDSTSGNVRPVDIASGSVGAALYDATPGTTTTPNQNGIGKGGAYAINTTAGTTAGDVPLIVNHDLASGQTRTQTRLNEANVGGVAGSIDPRSGLFYYGGYNTTTGRLVLWTYNPVTNAVAGPVARLEVPNAPGGNGDLAFSSTGQLYYVAASASVTALYRFDGTLPTTPTGTGTIFPATQTTELTRTTGLTAASNGIAFASDGYLYLGTSGQITKVNPITGDRVQSIPFAPVGGGTVTSTDLGSCAGPNAVEVAASFPDGRLDPADQVNVTLTGGDYDGTPAFPTGTTTGAETGKQDQDPSETAGPGILLPSTDYQVSVTGAGGTDLAKYVPSYTCTDVVTGAVLSSGPGTSPTVRLDPGTGTIADCTISLAQPAPALTLDTQVSPGSFSRTGDTLDFTFVIRNTGNVALSGLDLSEGLAGLPTPTCSPVAEGGTLQPGTTTTCTATYTVTGDDVRSGRDLTANGSVTGTPPPQQGTAPTATDSATATNAASGPTATDDQAAAPFGATVTLPASTNDTAGTSPVVAGSTRFTDPAATDGGTVLTVPEGTWRVQPDGRVTFTPAEGFSGTPASVEYEVADQDGLTDTALLTATVRPGPTATPDSADTDQGSAATLDPTANDTPGARADGSPGAFDPASVVLDPDAAPAGSTPSPDGKTLVVPGEGTWEVLPDGRVRFTPESTFVGTTSPVGYRVTDQAGNTTGSTMSVEVAAVDPVASDDTASTQFRTPVSLPAGTDDTPGPGGPIDQSATVLTSPEATDGGKRLVTAEGTWQVEPDGTVTFTPAEDFSGVTDPVEYRVTDANGQTDTGTLQVAVQPGPTAVDDRDVTTPQNVTTTVVPLGNDSPGPRADGSDGRFDPATLVLLADGLPDGSVLSPDGRTLSVPGEGTWTVDPGTGEVAFDPEPGLRGPTTDVRYRVEDQAGNPAGAAMAVTVTPVDPTAADDAAKTPAATPVDVAVLDNDEAGAATAPLVADSVVLTSPEATDGGKRLETAEGTWVVGTGADAGVLTFTPAPGFTGETEPVGYRVFDTNGESDDATVVVVVGRAPMAAPDTASTSQGSGVTLAPLANDVPGDQGTPCDPPGSDTPAGCDTGTFVPGSLRLTSDGLPADAVLSGDGTSLTVPGEGTWTVQPDGTVDFEPEPGFTGETTSVTYAVTDSYGNDASSTMTVDVRGVSPTATDDSARTPFATPVTLPGATNDQPGTDDNGTPGAPGDDTTVPLVPAATVFPDAGQPEGSVVTAGGTRLTVAGEGVWVVRPDGSVEFTPAEAFAGETSPVTYRIEDANGTTDTATLLVTVAAGPSAQPDTESTPSDTDVTVSPLANDTPGDRADGSAGSFDTGSLVLTGAGLPAGAELSADQKALTVPGEGTWTVQPDGTVDFDPEPGFTGDTTPVTYEVTDSFGNTTSSTMTVTIAQGPSARPDAESTPQNVDVTVSPLANDTPGDAADGSPGSFDTGSLVLTGAGVTDGGKTLTVPGEGTWTVQPDGTVDFDPGPGFTGDTTPVTYEVTDSFGNTTSSTMTVTVAPIAPVATDDTAATPFRTPVTLEGARDDEAGAESAPLVPGATVFPAAGQPDGAELSGEGTTLTVPDEGVWVIQDDGSVEFTPAGSFTGETSPVTYRIEDANGTTDTATLVVTVGDRPVASPDTATTPQDVDVTVSPLRNDIPGDDGTGEPGTFDAGSLVLLDVGLPAGSTFGEDEGKQTLTVPDEGTWTVQDDGTVVFDPLPTFRGETTPVTYEVTDSFGNTTGSTITVTVGPPAAPTTTTTEPGEPVTVDVVGDLEDALGVTIQPDSVCLLPATATWTTADGGTGTSTWAGDAEACVDSYTEPGVGTWQVNPDGTLTFTPAPGFTGTATIGYEATTSDGDTVGSEVTVTVAEAPQPEPPTGPDGPDGPGGPGGPGGPSAPTGSPVPPATGGSPIGGGTTGGTTDDGGSGLLPDTGGPALALLLLALGALGTGTWLVRRGRRSA